MRMLLGAWILFPVSGALQLFLMNLYGLADAQENKWCGGQKSFIYVGHNGLL
ncbi:hypothetical protein ASPBRDRAFT_45594 [Aspergillus brasiliensis CBS 101740]|uniref:Uncharacterized protein n=1 Tax=Aspergillus brasiliensis (strain CBS 101740 / IMI 381727 / IBT 21946) TaxID=767769 RepID=A0A1L9UCF1_ASPBC|nr:hypothetical protein ASPBRDRAFT_45594 [Aspergillus brasiliensis CBS 101740]